MQATPATWRLLLETDWPGSQQLKVLCGGEGLPRELANQLLERVGSLWNMYGPTETTVWSTVHAVESGEGSYFNWTSDRQHRDLHIGFAVAASSHRGSG